MYKCFHLYLTGKGTGICSLICEGTDSWNFGNGAVISNDSAKLVDKGAIACRTRRSGWFADGNDSAVLVGNGSVRLVGKGASIYSATASGVCHSADANVAVVVNGSKRANI